MEKVDELLIVLLVILMLVIQKSKQHACKPI